MAVPACTCDNSLGTCGSTARTGEEGDVPHSPFCACVPSAGQRQAKPRFAPEDLADLVRLPLLPEKQWAEAPSPGWPSGAHRAASFARNSLGRGRGRCQRSRSGQRKESSRDPLSHARTLWKPLKARVGGGGAQGARPQ